MSAPVVVVTGPPGAGKSTVAERIVRGWTPSALVAGDAFFAFLRGGHVDPWLPEAHAQNDAVVAAAAAATGELARGGITVVYEGVVGPWFLERFSAWVAVPELHYVVLLPGEDVCLGRVRTRSGHGFTDLDAARQMYREFADAGVDARHLLRTGAGDAPDAVAARLADLVVRGRARVGPRPPRVTTR